MVLILLACAGCRGAINPSTITSSRCGRVFAPEPGALRDLVLAIVAGGGLAALALCRADAAGAGGHLAILPRNSLPRRRHQRRQRDAGRFPRFRHDG